MLNNSNSPEPFEIRFDPCFLHRCFFNHQISFGFLFTLITMTRELPNHVKFFKLLLQWIFLSYRKYFHTNCFQSSIIISFPDSATCVYTNSKFLEFLQMHHLFSLILFMHYSYCIDFCQAQSSCSFSSTELALLSQNDTRHPSLTRHPE